MEPLKPYLTAIEGNLKTGNATEHTHRPALKSLIESLGENVTATNEPKRERCGAPDFQGVPQHVWAFHVGGYQVCHKWLKDRKGRRLSWDDIDHYQRLIATLDETIRLMAKIDEIIDASGGCPLS
ncbi:MAG: type ISP restriction/modification enzyme [Syntrophales bacterium]